MAPIAFRIKILTPQTQDLTQYKPSLVFFVCCLMQPVSPFLIFQPLPRFPTHKSSHMPSSPAEETACLSTLASSSRVEPALAGTEQKDLPGAFPHGAYPTPGQAMQD